MNIVMVLKSEKGIDGDRRGGWERKREEEREEMRLELGNTNVAGLAWLVWSGLVPTGPVIFRTGATAGQQGSCEL